MTEHNCERCEWITNRNEDDDDNEHIAWLLFVNPDRKKYKTKRKPCKEHLAQAFETKKRDIKQWMIKNDKN
jgi:hypothetical protein